MKKPFSLKKMSFKIFIIVFTIEFLFSTLIILSGINELFSDGFNMMTFFDCALVIIISSLEVSFPIILIYWVINSGMNKARKESMSKIDFSKDKGYYRDILKNYSPSELSYIDDFKVNAIGDVVATLLSLKLKNKIEIENDGIKIIDSEMDNLKQTEKYILKSINNGRVVIDYFNQIGRLSKEEAIEDFLVEKSNNTFKNIGKIIFLLVVIPFLLFKISISLGEKFMSYDYTTFDMLFTVFIILMFLIFIFGIIFTFAYSVKKWNSYKRTDKGEQINIKLEGLKNYIKNFSILDKRCQDELVLWEDYLIYSIVFGVNKKIVNDIKKFIIFGKKNDY